MKKHFLFKNLFYFLIGFCITLILNKLSLYHIEAFFYDLRVRLNSDIKPSSHVTMLLYDDAAKEKSELLGVLPYINEVLRRLILEEPTSIAILPGILDGLDDGPYSKADARAINQFLSLANTLKQNGTDLFLGFQYDPSGELILPKVLRRIPSRLAVIHKDTYLFSEDKVTRRALYDLNQEPTLHVSLSERFSKVNINHLIDLKNTLQYIPEINANTFLFQYFGGPTLEQTHYPRMSTDEFLDGKPFSLKNKIVLLGSISNENANDFTFTPFSRQIFSTPKILVHANITETLIQDSLVHFLADWMEFIINLALTTVIIFLVFSSKPKTSFIVTATIIAIYALISYEIFRHAHISLRMGHTILSALISYYIFLPYRLMREYQQSNLYKEQNRILKQLDQMKQNFVGLITHDLKTPVARIQGLAEVLQRADYSRSTDKDKAISGILETTFELNRSISSILELTKIDNNSVQIHRFCRDINKVLRDTAEKFQHELPKKQLTIEWQLEELFPFYFDPELMTKVFSNLIDNAIRYSDIGSSIRIFSKQLITPQSSAIEILIINHGPGMTADQIANAFQRFNRSNSFKANGFGLGLYLSHFFVEKHGGTLTLTSNKQATTARVLIPEITDIELKDKD